MTPTLRLASLTKTFDAITVVDDVDLDLPTGSFTALLGPSGCGKSTTLQMVAGLVEPDAGCIEVDGADVRGIPAERRPISLVFQKPLLFPHLTVGQNVGFGLRMLRRPRGEIAERVADMLDRVQLGALAGRRPHELSGGQEQRVALARALVLEPSLLLLDEPFSQLDASLRAEMRDLVRNLHDSSGVTTLFVTHDQAEAVEIADRIVIMLNGSVEAYDSPENLYARPPSLATARFMGVGNELLGTVGDATFRIGETTLKVPHSASPGAGVLVARPESVQLAPPTTDALAVTLDAVRFAGSHLVVSGVTDDDQRIGLHVPVGTRVDAGERIGVHINPDRCTVFTQEET